MPNQPSLKRTIEKAFPAVAGKTPRPIESVTLASRAVGISRQSLHACINKNKLSAQLAADLVRTSKGRITPDEVVPYLDKTVLESYRFLLNRPNE